MEKPMKFDTDPKVQALQKIMQELFSIEQTLHGVVHPQISEKINSLHKLAHSAIADELEQEERDWESNQKGLDEISSANNLRSVWSVSEIKHTNMNDLTPEMTEIIYESWGPTQVHKFEAPTQVTWLELWKIGDKLIKCSEDTHHIFIESFEPVKGQPGKYKMWTGS
jgi:hypothetical protein